LERILERSRGDVDGSESLAKLARWRRRGPGWLGPFTLEEAQVLRRCVDQALAAGARVDLEDARCELVDPAKLDDIAREERPGARPLERLARPPYVPGTKKPLGVVEMRHRNPTPETFNRIPAI
jgi:hypothetical protein